MDRIEGLAAFVSAWAEDGDPLRTLIRDALRHEQTVALLRSADQDQSACPTAGSPPLAVPAPNGHLRVHILSCDPRSLQRILADRPAHLLDIERGRWTFIYHRTAERLRVLEVEHAVGDLITAVDGRSSVRDIAARLFGDPDETQALNSLFEQLVEIGLLRWGTGGAEQCG